MADFTIKPLAPETFAAFARLIERQGASSFGPPSCWCLWFHPNDPDKEPGVAGNRALKERLVCEGRAHAALVFDDDLAVGWCQYGSPAELPNIYHRKEYEATVAQLPDYRLTCFYVDKKYRHRGVAGAALRGALDLIAQAGGGVVEGYPRDAPNKISSSFLYSCTRSTFEQAGFTYDRPKGKLNCVMTMTVAPARLVVRTDRKNPGN